MISNQNSGPVKVTVAMMTYNLAQYIEKALDSVLAQKTEFPFVIRIADDASDDGTVDILKRYQGKYGDKIELLLSDKNQGALANSCRVFDKIQGEYFTFLDGDDYWVGEDRLQRQVDFLDTHPEYMMVAGNTRYLIDGEAGNFLLKREQLNQAYSFDDLLHDTMPFFHTSAILVRNKIYVNGMPQCYWDKIGTFEECALRGEDFRRIIHLEQGPLYAMDELVSYYRIHSQGIWQGSTETRRVIETAISNNFRKKYFGDKYEGYFVKRAEKAYVNLMEMMIYKYGLGHRYSLSGKDNWLFTELLRDIGSNEPENEGQCEVIYKKWEKRVLVMCRKILRWKI